MSAFSALCSRWVTLFGAVSLCFAGAASASGCSSSPEFAGDSSGGGMSMPGSAVDAGMPGMPATKVDAGIPGMPANPADGTVPDVHLPPVNADGGATPEAGPAPMAPGAAIDGKCVPFCANASTDPDGDGYGFEKGVSCVVPGGMAAVGRRDCLVGGPLPPVGHLPGDPGVVAGAMCVPYCSSSIVDDDHDGYGFEFDASCIFRGSTVAATALACTVGGMVPTGGMYGSAGRLIMETCNPFCTNASSDPDGDGFGFEFGLTCVMPNAPAAAKGIDCQVGVPEPLLPAVALNPNPPPGAVAKPASVHSTGFFVSGGRLYDKFGNAFVPRGVNSPDIWFDISDQYFAYNSLDNIAAFGANAVRIVWLTTGDPVVLRRVLRHAVDLHLIPIVELHDETGNTSDATLLNPVAAYYERTDVKQVLLDYEPYLLINIANEWSGTNFRGAYQAAIASLRASGIHHTLVIDANGSGQNAASILTDGPALVASDPEQNLLFSVHMYGQYSTANGNHTTITNALQGAISAGVAIMVGEFGWQAGTPPVAIDAPFIMSECVRLGLGYLAWSWKGNDPNLSYLDLSVDWEGTQLSSWGNTVIKGPSGITATGTIASIFRL